MTPLTIKWSSLSQGRNVCDTRENKVKTDDGQNRHTVQLTNVTLAIVKGTHCDRQLVGTFCRITTTSCYYTGWRIKK